MKSVHGRHPRPSSDSDSWVVDGTSLVALITRQSDLAKHRLLGCPLTCETFGSPTVEPLNIQEPPVRSSLPDNQGPVQHRFEQIQHRLLKKRGETYCTKHAGASVAERPLQLLTQTHALSSSATKMGLLGISPLSEKQLEHQARDGRQLKKRLQTWLTPTPTHIHLIIRSSLLCRFVPKVGL